MLNGLSLQTRYGQYKTSEEIPKRIPHAEMEAAKSKFRIETYFYVTIGIIVTAAWVAYLSRDQLVQTIIVKIVAMSFCLRQYV